MPIDKTGKAAAHGYFRRGNFGGSVFRCVLMAEWYSLQQLWLNDAAYGKNVWRNE